MEANFIQVFILLEIFEHKFTKNGQMDTICLAKHTAMYQAFHPGRTQLHGNRPVRKNLTEEKKEKNNVQAFWKPPIPFMSRARIVQP